MADANEQVYAHRFGELSGFVVVGPGHGAELEHPAEYGDEAASLMGGVLGPVAQDGGYGCRGGVIGVVVDHDVVPQPVHLAPEPRTPEARDAFGALLQVETERECPP